MSIISQFKNHFLKSRIIGLSYHVDKNLIQLLKNDLQNIDETFLIHDSMKYYELKFYSQIAQRWKINPSYFSSTELEKYYESVEKMKKFEEIHKIFSNLANIFWDLKCLYVKSASETSTPNFWNRREYISHLYQEDLKDAIDRYNDLLIQMKNYPEWEQRVRDEVGYELHMIYTTIIADDNLRNLFKNFDVHYYFK